MDTVKTTEGPSVRAFIRSLRERYPGGIWQLVALIAGVVLLLAGIATARFGLFSGGPAVRAAEPHTLPPPPSSNDQATPAPLPPEESAVPLSPQAAGVESNFRVSQPPQNQETHSPERHPATVSGGREPRVAKVTWSEENAASEGQDSIPDARESSPASPQSSWVLPPMQDAGTSQPSKPSSPTGQSPSPGDTNLNSAVVGPSAPEEQTPSQNMASGPAPDNASSGRNGSGETRQAPPENNPTAPQTLPDSAGNPTPMRSATPGPTAVSGASPAASPFDTLPPPSTNPARPIVEPPGTRPLVSSPAPIPANTAGSANPLATAESAGIGAEGDARPGDASLEGPQSPQVTVHKIVPDEVQVGKPATFRIVVRNSGAIAVPKVEVHDPIPWGIRVLRTNPSAAQGSQGTLVWTLGPLKPGDEVVLEAEVMPLQEGELGSVVTVMIHSQASAKTKCTRPQLTVKTQVQPQAMIGEEVLVTMTVSNSGSGIATNVILEEHVPPELQHPAGNELENALGDLKPGESRQVQLKLQAIRAGNAVNRLIARADGNLRVEDQATIQVLAPEVDVTIDGPARRFLDRETIYQISLTNRGTASAKNVRLTASLAAGLQFVRTNNAGSYDPSTHSVQWLLAELPIGQTGTVELVVNPIAAGQQDLVCSVRDDLGVGDEKRLTVVVEGISALHFQVADTKDPVAVGMETAYEIRVVNQGTKEATNVQVMATFPEGIRPLAGEGPVPNTVNGNEVLFGKLNRLAPKGEAIFRIRCQALSPGDQRIRVQILSDDIRLPVTKEESTQVYSDSE